MEVGIKVATLNFTGINNSPFEYHDGSKDKIHLDQIMGDLLREQPEFNDLEFVWNIGKIDTMLQKGRYSPAYRSDVGVVKGKLVDKQQFQLLWNHYYDINQDTLAKANPTETNIARCMLLDWNMYLAMVTHCFGKVDLNKIKSYDASIYSSKLKAWHSVNYMELNTRMEQVVRYLENEKLSVLFLQEVGPQDWSSHLPQGYKSKRKGNSLVIYASNHLQEPHSYFDEKYQELLDFNKDTVYLKTRRQLFISAHLTAKSNNVEQASQMYQVLARILSEYPELNIIVGMDANHFVKAKLQFHTFPQHENQITTRKKRTLMQPQYNKANKLIEEVKDLILSNCTIKDGSIQTIHSKPPGKEVLLPTEDHPFDHLIVKGKIRVSILEGGLRKSRSKDVSNSEAQRERQKKVDRTP